MDDRQSSGKARVRRVFSISMGWILGVAALFPPPAHAVDGCLVLLCFVAPNWRSIPQCVSPVQQALRDLLHGRPFPTCSMAGAGNSASARWSNAPTYCPPQYTHVDYLESGARYSCDYDGAIEVDVAGVLWTRTWWSASGDSVTEFSVAAKTQIGTWDTRFEDDYASWLAANPPVSPATDSAGG
jgi:hypothetical protein